MLAIFSAASFIFNRSGKKQKRRIIETKIITVYLYFFSSFFLIFQFWLFLLFMRRRHERLRDNLGHTNGSGNK